MIILADRMFSRVGGSYNGHVVLFEQGNVSSPFAILTDIEAIELRNRINQALEQQLPNNCERRRRDEQL